MRILLAIYCSIIFILPTLAQVYPPPACIFYENGTLTVCPPDSVPDYTGGLLGYNVFVDGEFVENLPAGSPDDSVTMIFDPLPMPGYRDFCATANYVNWISEFTCDSAFVYYGYDLPFTEDWSSGSFETNSWTQEGNYWEISEEDGDPVPSAIFTGNTGLDDYSVPLTSYIFKVDSILEGSIKIIFYSKLECNQNTGSEKLNVQVWEWANQSWINYLSLNNINGSYNWKQHQILINAVKGKLFKFRFVAYGVNSEDIKSWRIDNINVERTCIPPHSLSATLNADSDVELSWDNFEGGCEEGYYIYWHNYVYGNLSIGTGEAVEFDVAARWSSDQLYNYAGLSVSRIYFFPAESSATYTGRIWEGDEAILMAEKEAQEIIPGQWNSVTLDTAHPIDVTKSLWVGYHVNTTTGYPAGVDDGPEINGFGNMIYIGDQWQTLLEVNPDLYYNWLIEAYLGVGDPEYCGSRVYRKINDGDYALIADIGVNVYYLDEGANPEDLNCYLVSNYFAKNYDTCESAFTNESCVQAVAVQENLTDNDLTVYPNPAHDEIYIESNYGIDELEMIDVTGRVVFHEEKLKRESVIEVNQLSEGIYLMRFLMGKAQVYRKICIASGR